MVSRILCACLVCVLCSSCAIDGRLYTNKVVPFSDDFNRTRVGSKTCYVEDYKVKEPISGYNISAEWMTTSVCEKAREAGITQIYYADLKVFSVLLGIYGNKTLIVYGD